MKKNSTNRFGRTTDRKCRVIRNLGLVALCLGAGLILAAARDSAAGPFVPAAVADTAFRTPESRPPAASDGQRQKLTNADPPVYRSAAADRDAVSITVYNQNFGLVREVRTVDLERGTVALQFADVASAIQTETVSIKALDRAPFHVLEQNYQYDLLSPKKLLAKYVGRTVKVYRWNQKEGRDESVEAEVLAVNGGTILKIGDEITFNYPGRIAFPEVPENLIAEPTLVWLLQSGADRRRLEVSYLTNNLNWKADYVVVVNDEVSRGDLTGWVTLTNQSGTTYEHAQLKLVAGDVQRVGGRVDMMRSARAMAEVAQDRAFAEEGFFEYHLYTLNRPATIRNNEQKQLTLLEAGGFGLRKELIYYGAARYYRGSYGTVESNTKVGVFLDFRNSEKNHLGMPLPAGVVRVYKRDSSGAQQFIGENRIDHTPRDERVRIKMGEAFDVVGDRRQMEWNALGSCTAESAWQVDLRNHKDERVEVEVVEPVGDDWRILSSSQPATKLDAHTFKFHVEIPARDTAKVTYRVRVRWC